jgi:subtilisin-like proprotein convertase family protein
MKATFLSIPACVLILSPCGAGAATILANKPVNLAIPDNNDSGLASVINVTTGGGQTVTVVEVTLTTHSGWNGDLYAYLEHDGVISVLLNRPGRTDANPAGAGSSGMTITLADSASQDVHTAMPATVGVPATGTYQPDARSADPLVVTDTSPRTLYLGAFTGHLADGNWTLFVADQADGGVATMDSWGLSLTVIPEPAAALLGGVGLLTLLRRRRNV